VSVRLSVTSRCSTKMAKRRITQATPHNSPGTSFLLPKISAKFERGHPNGGVKCRWVRLKSTISTFCVVFRIFALGERRNLKFGRRVDHSKSQPTDNKSSLKEAWSRHVTHFKFRAPDHISRTTEPTSSNFVDMYAALRVGVVGVT